MNKLAKYIIAVAIIAIIAFLAWYFSSILWYILIAAVISTVGKPLVNLITSISIKKFKVPNWLAALITLVVIFSVIGGIFMFITPLIGQIFNELGNINLESLSTKISEPLLKYNIKIREIFPTLGNDFRLELYLFDEIKSIVNVSAFTSLFSSVTTFFVDFAIGLFAVIFISFFFLQEQNMLGNILKAIVPDKYEENMTRALSSSNNLLVRYFLGISIECIFITILNTIGLHYIAGLDFSLAVVLAFVSGILNVIPYIGPITSGAIGVLMAVITHYGSMDTMYLWPFVIIIIAVYFGTHMIDIFVFQPFIYSSSVKAHPLEIFLVILIAGYIGGVLGMLIAIPTYTVIRVFASEFLSKFKVVQKLTKNI
ncbi:MAG: AI-2E family transporter [Bacteroidales bacterium]|nr:AI-2E family transporter [Bacteroidales bacterium]